MRFIDLDKQKIVASQNNEPPVNRNKVRVSVDCKLQCSVKTTIRFYCPHNPIHVHIFVPDNETQGSNFQRANL